MRKYEVKSLVDSNRITKYQGKGMLLEIAVYEGLINIGIYPIPLHNPYDEKYSKDQHLNVDLIFRHFNSTFGVECKNLNAKWGWDRDWVEKQVIDRFNFLEKTVPVDYRLLVTSYPPNNVPSSISTLILDWEVTYNNLPSMTLKTSNLFLSLFSQIEEDTTMYSTHGYIVRKTESQRMKRIDERLKRKSLDGWVEKR